MIQTFGRLFFPICLIAGHFAFAQFQVPKLAGPINDSAGFLGASARAELDSTLRQLWQSGGPQLAILTVDTLNGVPIEQASIQVTDQWKLGDEKKDNGILLLIAKSERTIRIEVGQGLEGELTDVESKRIIEDVILPNFKSGQFESGILEGVSAILSRVAPEFQLKDAHNWFHRQVEPPDFISIILTLLFGLPIIPILIFFFVVKSMGRGRRRFRSGGHWGGGFGGGGFGGFGGGGFGGFGGGGGGFSGGGASGRW